MIPIGLLNELAGERLRQDTLWGWMAHDDQNSNGDWLLVIDHYLARALHSDFRENLVKVTAASIAAIEAYDRIHSSIGKTVSPTFSNTEDIHCGGQLPGRSQLELHSSDEEEPDNNREASSDDFKKKLAAKLVTTRWPNGYLNWIKFMSFEFIKDIQTIKVGNKDPKTTAFIAFPNGEKFRVKVANFEWTLGFDTKRDESGELLDTQPKSAEFTVELTTEGAEAVMFYLLEDWVKRQKGKRNL